MKDRKIPGVIFRRVILTGCFAFLCGVVGVAAGCSGDRILAGLSAAVAACSIFRAVTDCFAAGKGKINVVEGVCTEIIPVFRKFKNITLEDSEGKEVKLRLQKKIHIVTGGRYRFYFRNIDSPGVGLEYVDSLLSVGNFLGVERV